MTNNLLSFEIDKLQLEYKIILEKAINDYHEKDICAILDEINIFWSKNKQLVRCAIQYLAKPYKTYVFTAATILDIDSFDHYPFLCFGKCHIWDDPIYSYYNMVKSSNQKFKEKITSQILRTIKDNIRILTEFDNKILILPLRIVSENSSQQVVELAQNAFFSLFKKPPKSYDDYINTFNTIDEIDGELRKNLKNRLILSDKDKKSDSFITRFNKYKATATLPIDTDAKDSVVFWFTVLGYLCQAIDIILTASACKFVPYIRFNVSFSYILILSDTCKVIPELEDWLSKCIVSYLLHTSFDNDKYSKIEFNEYVDKARNFESLLYSEFDRENISVSNSTPKKIIEKINAVMEICFLSP